MMTKFRDFLLLLLLYALPIFCVGYINHTKCWSYDALKHFYKNTAGEHKQWVNTHSNLFRNSISIKENSISSGLTFFN